MGAQWLSGRVLDLRPKGHGFKPHRRHCLVSLSKNINPSLVLVQPRKTRPFITERLLMGRKESNHTNKQSYRASLQAVPTSAHCSAVGNVSGNRCESDCRSRAASSIPAWSHTFVEIDHEIISTVILLLLLNHSRRVVVSYKRKYVHEVLVNCLFRLAQEKLWLGELTVPQ